jgi:phage FluMu gp28-like protein
MNTDIKPLDLPLPAFTAAGNIRFEGERQNNSHADRFWAACAALEAAASPPHENKIWAVLI